MASIYTGQKFIEFHYYPADGSDLKSGTFDWPHDYKACAADVQKHLPKGAELRHWRGPFERKEVGK